MKNVLKYLAYKPPEDERRQEVIIGDLISKLNELSCVFPIPNDFKL